MSVATVMTTDRLALVPVTQAHAAAIGHGYHAVEELIGLPLAEGVFDLLGMGDADFWAVYARRKEIESWSSGYWIVLLEEHIVVGMCGCVNVPDDSAAVEIGYGVSPLYEGRGIATEAARIVTMQALRGDDVSTVIAHTLPEQSASARVLAKCGFVRSGEDVDPDEGVVWRWERHNG